PADQRGRHAAGGAELNQNVHSSGDLRRWDILVIDEADDQADEADDRAPHAPALVPRLGVLSSSSSRREQEVQKPHSFEQPVDPKTSYGAERLGRKDQLGSLCAVFQKPIRVAAENIV